MNVLQSCSVRLNGLAALATVLISAVLCLSIHVQTLGQFLPVQTKKLSVSENALVKSSRSAIIESGISAQYFDKHFTLRRVIDKVNDRRVEWRYSIGEYVTTLNDAVGFYTNEKGQRVNVHAIRNYLSSSHDIKSTIPRKRAEQLMRQCIGKHTVGPVVFQAFGSSHRALLLLTASSIVNTKDGRRKEQRKESEENRSEEEVRQPSERSSRLDTVEEGDDEGDNERPVVITGFVDLETGGCTKGIAQAEHPVP